MVAVCRLRGFLVRPSIKLAIMAIPTPKMREATIMRFPVGSSSIVYSRSTVKMVCRYGKRVSGTSKVYI